FAAPPSFNHCQTSRLITRVSRSLRQGRGGRQHARAFSRFLSDASREGMTADSYSSRFCGYTSVFFAHSARDHLSGVASLPQSRLKDLEKQIAMSGKFLL